MRPFFASKIPTLHRVGRIRAQNRRASAPSHRVFHPLRATPSMRLRVGLFPFSLSSSFCDNIFSKIIFIMSDILRHKYDIFCGFKCKASKKHLTMAAAKQQLKKYTRRKLQKNCLRRSTDQKGTAEKKTFLHPDDLFSILSILSILSYPSYPFPTRSSFPAPLPILSPTPFSVPFRLDLHSYPHPSGIFSDLIPVLAPFHSLSLPGDLKSIVFYKKNNFWKRVRLRQYFYDIFEESALQLPPLQPLRKMTIGTNAAQKRQIFYIFETVCIVSLRFS